jgi:hypothetical protein
MSHIMLSGSPRALCTPLIADEKINKFLKFELEALTQNKAKYWMRSKGS